MQNTMQSAPIESSRKLDGKTISIFKMFFNMDFLPRLALN